MLSIIRNPVIYTLVKDMNHHFTGVFSESIYRFISLPRIDLSTSAKEQILGSEVESSKVRHLPVGFPRFKRILIAYDGTQMSKKALSYAAYISRISDSEVVVISVVKGNKDRGNVLPISMKVNLIEKEEEIDIEGSHQRIPLNEALQKVIEEMTAECKAVGMTEKIKYEIRKGNPADEIINLSNLMYFDLILMGSRRLASRIAGIGSTTRKVAATLKIPLLIVQKQPRYKDEW